MDLWSSGSCVARHFRRRIELISFFRKVTSILLLAIFHTTITCVTPYVWLVTDYGNPTVLRKLRRVSADSAIADISSTVQAPWSFALDPLLTGIVGLLVQLFYAHKLFRISGRQYVLPGIVVFLSAVQVGFSFGATLKVFIVRRFLPSFSSSFHPFVVRIDARW